MNHRTQFIAEVSSNHHQDPECCLRFIDAAAGIGCDAIKFQLFRIDELFAPEILDHSAEHRARRAWELPVAFLPDLARHCQQRGIGFSCTPFYLDAVAELEPWVAFYKIASYELIWDALLAACARTGKPVVLSTGMANLNEVRHAVEVLREAGGQDITLLHCVSAYPAQAGECNLAAIDTLRCEFRCKAGWSDHSVNSAVIARAVNHWRADMIEFHLDLEGEGAEYAAGHCWLPDAIRPLIAGEVVPELPEADGDGRKLPVEREVAERPWRADPDDGLRPFKYIRSATLTT